MCHEAMAQSTCNTNQAACRSVCPVTADECKAFRPQSHLLYGEDKAAVRPLNFRNVRRPQRN